MTINNSLNISKAEYDRNRRRWLEDFNEQKVFFRDLPVLENYKDFVFSHSLRSGFNGMKTSEQGILALKNIIKNSDKNMELSASRPGEELHDFGVYVKGDVKDVYNQDISSTFFGSDKNEFINSETGKIWDKNYALTYEEQKKIQEIKDKYGEMSSEELKRIGVNPELAYDTKFWSKETFEEFGINPDINLRTISKEQRSKWKDGENIKILKKFNQEEWRQKAIDELTNKINLLAKINLATEVLFITHRKLYSFMNYR